MSTCYNPFSLQNKRILVTGASSGIGRAIAIECTRLGARLIITGRSPERLVETKTMLSGTDHELIVADLSLKDDCLMIADKVQSLDGCVLSIGITHLAPVKFATREKMNPVFDSNFFAPIELTRILIKEKRLSKGSSIVCIASIGGIKSFDYAHCIYGASKAALSSWMKFAAKELASQKIRVNNICPGMTKTALATPGTITQDQLDADAQRYPLKRYAEPQEIAWATVYFLSDASRWVTGTDFIIDGGLTLT